MAHDSIRLLHSLFLPAVGALRQAGWQPSADVYRTPDGWLVKLDLAGVRPEDTQVSVHGRHLIVRGTRRDWCVEEGCRHYSMEISYSRFERSIALPTDLEHARLATEHRHGMLLVRIRKEAQP
jgi:HSP20 family protein